MTRPWSIATLFLLATCFACGKQAAEAAPPSQTIVVGAEAKVFNVGPDVTAPEYLPVELQLSETGECKEKVSGKAVLSFVVDAEGITRKIAFEEGLGNGLDGLAFKIVSADRFKPATHEGAPVTVAMEGEVTLEACSLETPTPAGDTQILMRLHLQPKQKFIAMPLSQSELEFASFPPPTATPQDAPGTSKWADMHPPTPTNSIAAIYSDEARVKKISGVCLVSLIVDAEGKPRDVRVKRPLGYGLDQKAVEAARRYRFKPAMKNGIPVPVMITVEVGFRVY